MFFSIFFPGGNEDTASNNIFISKIFIFIFIFLFYSISDIFIIYFEKTNYMSKTSIENLVENVSLFIGLVIQLQQ